MNVLDTLRGLVRRWYITVPGIVIAIAAAIGMWVVTPSDHTRTATQLLLPGAGILPDGATNQYLYMGGLIPVADVLTRAVAADADIGQMRQDLGAEVTIARDGAAAGPVVTTTVTGPSDTAVAELLEVIVFQMGATLNELQAEQDIPVADRVTASTIAIDDESTIRDRPRLIAAGAVGVAGVLVFVVLASVFDGLMMKRRRRSTADGDPVDAAVSESDAQSAAENLDDGAEVVDDVLDDHEFERRLASTPPAADDASRDAESDSVAGPADAPPRAGRRIPRTLARRP